MVANTHVPTHRLSDALDLRRRHSRELAERLVELAAHTNPEDRALIEAVYRDGVTAARLATLSGRTPRAVRQRIRTIVTRLLSPRFAYVLAHGDAWPTRRRRIADACVLKGLSIREAAEALGLSVHAVRRQLDLINALADAGGTR